MTESNKMADLVGPFYDTDGIATTLGIPVDTLPAMRNDGLLLGVQASDGTWLYPVFQITGTTLNPDLLPAIQAMRCSPGWSAAVWFCTPDEDLNGLTPIEWARVGNDPSAMVRLAGQTAHRWAA